MRAAIALIFVVAAACDAHEPVCEPAARAVHCVEACGGPPFIACDACPEGSMPAEACDGGVESDASR